MALSSLQLEAFHCLAKTSHFTRASRLLRISQSALSQRIGNLEAELGATLFIRGRAGASLTPAGRELLRYCQVKDGLENEFLSVLKSGKPDLLAGELRLGGFSSVTHSILLPALAPILRRNPGVRLSLQTRELEELPGMLQRAEVDFVVLDHKWQRDGIVSLKLGEEENVLIQKRGYRGADVYLDHDPADATTERYFRAHRERWSGRRHFLDDIGGIIQGVRCGLGRAVVARHLIEGDSGIEILSPRRSLRVPIVLHYYEQPYYTKLHEAVIQVLSRRTGSHYGQSEGSMGWMNSDAPKKV